MATTLVASGTVGNVAQATGHSNASTLVYGINSARWFLFLLTAGDTTHVNCYISSSNDLSTATWTTIGTGTQSPVFGSSDAHTANEGRNFACAYENVGATDVVYCIVGMTKADGGADSIQANRVTLTSSVATWGTWANQAGTAGTANTPDGSAVGISTTNRTWLFNSRDTTDRDWAGTIASNVDAGTSWTAGYGAAAAIDNSMANTINSGAIMPLAAGLMLGMADSGTVTATTTNHIFVKSSSATAWPANAARSTIFAGATAAAQDKNDWGAVGVSTTDVHVVRRKTSTAFEHRRYDGTAWGTLVNITSTGITAHLAGSGIGLASNGTDVWAFIIDTDANKSVMYLHWTSAGGWDAAWTALSTGGDTVAKNFISVSKTAGNSQIGVNWTENASTPFAIMGSFLSTSGAVVTLPPGLGPGMHMEPTQTLPMGW